MSRRLLAALLLASLPVFGARSSACPTCDLPPASVAASDPAPQAVFEAEAPGALLPEERDWLKTADDGRYEPVHGRLSDHKAVDPGKHLLTNSAAWTLLGRRASERTAVLRSLAKNGILPEAARGEAVSLFWVRGTLVSPEDRTFLREAVKFRSRPEPGVGAFEGGIRSPAPAPMGDGENPAANLSADSAVLLRSLLGAIEVAPDADPRASAAMTEAFQNLVRTPTGRELAVEFLAAGAKAKVEFGDVENSITGVQNGRRVLLASGGHAITSENPPRVVLNRHYLDTDPDYRRVHMAGTLGHELFGHSFEAQRAKKTGVSPEALFYYRGDEAGAGLIGWLVTVELGGRLDNGHMWSYLSDRERYHANLRTNLPYYTTTLSTSEMHAPIRTLQGRVAAIGIERKSSRESTSSTLAWRHVIEHFVSVHAMDRQYFSSIWEALVDSVLWFNTHQTDLDDINDYLTRTLKNWRKSSSRALMADLAKASRSTYMRQAEERLSARAERLRGLVAGRAPQSAIPPIPEKLDWDDLYRLLDQDRKDHPDHWGIKK